MQTLVQDQQTRQLIDRYTQTEILDDIEAIVQLSTKLGSHIRNVMETLVQGRQTRQLDIYI